MAKLNKLPRSPKSIYKPFEIKSFSDEQKKDLEQWISTRLEETITASADRLTNIKKYRKGYAGNQYQRDPAYEGGANVRIPIAPTLLDAIHLRLVQSHFGVTPYVRVNPSKSREGVDADISRGMEDMIWYVHYLRNTLLTGYLVIKDALLIGTGVSKTVWKQDWRLVRAKGKKKYVLRENLPDHEYIPAENFVIYPTNALDVDSAQFVGHRFWRRWDQLMRGVALGIYNEDWVNEIEQMPSMATPSTTDERAGVKVTSSDWKDQPYELFEMIVGYDLDEDGLDEDYLVVFDRVNRKIIRMIDYPAGYGERWYHLYTPMPNGDSVFGDSAYAQIEAFDEEITTIHNARLDNDQAVNFPSYTVVVGSPAAKDDKRIRPGEKIKVTEHDDIKPLVQIPPLRDTSGSEDKLMYYAQLRLGVSELNLGRTPPGEKTAYEIEASLAEGSIRIRLEVALGILWLKRVAWHEIGLMKDFLPSDTYEHVTGQPNPLDAMAWEDLWANFNLEPTGNSTTSNRELERQKWVFVVESMKSDPLVFTVDPMSGQATPKEGWYELRKRFLLAHGIDDYQTIIGPAPAPAAPVEQPQPEVLPPEAILPAMQTAAQMGNMPTPQEMALPVANEGVVGTVPGAI